MLAWTVMAADGHGPDEAPRTRHRGRGGANSGRRHMRGGDGNVPPCWLFAVAATPGSDGPAAPRPAREGSAARTVLADQVKRWPPAGRKPCVDARRPIAGAALGRRNGIAV